MKFGDDKGWPCIDPPWGELIAVNANTGDIAWRSPLGSVDDYGERGKTAGTVNLGGSVATASGLVFIGATIDSRFRAFDSHTGKLVWTTSIPGPGVANPVIFRGKSGREYVVIAAGGPATMAVPGRMSSYREILVAYALPREGEAPVDLSQYAPVAAPPWPGRFANRSGAPTPSQTPIGINGELILPAAPRREDVLSMCGQCHGISTTVAVRRSSDAWHDVIQDMRSRGAQGDNARAVKVQEYLTRYFGLTPPADPATPPR